VIVFVGNALSTKGRAISYTEFLVGQLARKSREQVVLISRKKNKIIRLLHACLFIFANRKKIKLVFIDTFSTTAFYYAYTISLLCQWIGKNYTLVLHGGNLPLRFKQSPAMMNRILSRADKIVCPSFYLGNFFAAQGYSVEVIPNALDMGLYPFKNRSNVQPNLLWVRAFDNIYNPLLAIKVLQQLLRDYPNAKLTMIGPIKDESYAGCQDYVKENQLEASVTLKGLMTREQWISESRAYDFFLNTTTIDNQPISVLEAMALGLLVISTNVGGIPFLINHAENGFMVNSGDATGIADIIKNLLSLPAESREKISNSARYFSEQFDWTAIEPKWFKLIS
jgi:L-malate glycosyltransferase